MYVYTNSPYTSAPSEWYCSLYVVMKFNLLFFFFQTGSLYPAFTRRPSFTIARPPCAVRQHAAARAAAAAASANSGCTRSNLTYLCVLLVVRLGSLVSFPARRGPQIVASAASLPLLLWSASLILGFVRFCPTSCERTRPNTTRILLHERRLLQRLHRSVQRKKKKNTILGRS